MRGMGEIVHRRSERLARTQDVAFGEGRVSRSALSEQITAEEGARGDVHDQPTFPGVRHVRGVEPAHRPPAEAEILAVGENARGAFGEVRDRDHRGDSAAYGKRLRSNVEKVVERAALV